MTSTELGVFVSAHALTQTTAQPPTVCSVMCEKYIRRLYTPSQLCHKRVLPYYAFLALLDNHGHTAASSYTTTTTTRRRPD